MELNVAMLPAQIVRKCIRHPLRFVQEASLRRVVTFFRILRAEGAAGVLRRLDNVLIGSEIPRPALDIVMPEQGHRDKIEEYPVLNFRREANPIVSIIVPACNQFDYTYACLAAVLKHTGEVAYEVIVADDNSTDMTRDMEKAAKNITIVRNRENMRFLRNCNNAAKNAAGKYICFLNNDTQVQNNWLEPLLALMEADETVGLTGSKLLFPEGTLQEAGGIIWRDGSADRYGGGANPGLPEFNYIKDVDYISGASILVRRSIWDKVEGFDERYAPAYCEDSDLAFAVRALGHRVVYQPASLVVHFDGVSHGKDVNSGQKAYQRINQRKFFAKWRETLERDHFVQGENILLARDRSQGKKHMLMIDHGVPKYDCDAGSRSVFHYLALFTRQGFQVTFLGDNFSAPQPYTDMLQQMGIEVLYGRECRRHWKEWLRNHGEALDYVFLNRPNISVKYISAVRKLTRAKIIYYGHDLHYLREMRQYELHGDKNLLKSSEVWKKKELYMMKKADVSYYPSSYEVFEIKKMDDSINVRAIPLYIYENCKVYNSDFNERKDIVFVGGFGHPPNIDAAMFLAKKICPEVLRRRPDIKFYVVGSNAPKEVSSVIADNYAFKSSVTDVQLAELYRRCRLAIAPLRYGAGVKGKVLEAMYHGLPMLTTSIGAEGLDGAGDILFIQDDAAGLISELLRVYDDTVLLQETSRREQEYVRKYFSSEAALQAVRQDIAFPDSRVEARAC